MLYKSFFVDVSQRPILIRWKSIRCQSKTMEIGCKGLLVVVAMGRMDDAKNLERRSCVV